MSQRKSIHQQLLEQKARQQERAARAEEKAQANIIANMTLPSQILAVNDPNQLKALILLQMKKTDELLHKFEGLQTITQRQEAQLSQAAKQDCPASDEELVRLQKELDEAQKAQREALNQQKQSLNQMDQIRADAISNKRLAGQQVIDQYKKQARQKSSYLSAQQKVIGEMTLESLYQCYTGAFGANQDGLQKKNEELQGEIGDLETQMKQLSAENASKEPAIYQQISQQETLNRIQKERAERLTQYSQFLNVCQRYIAHKRDREQIQETLRSQKQLECPALRPSEEK